MRRRWLVSCGAFLVGMMFVAVAWSQSPASLAERIQQLRRSWSDEAPATAQRSPSTAAPNTVAPQQAPTPLPAGHGGLPQIDARSLLPTQLFSRPTSGTVDDGRDTTPATDPHALPQTAAQPRVASVQSSDRVADGFTLPGLGSSLSNPTRAMGSTLPRPLDAGSPFADENTNARRTATRQQTAVPNATPTIPLANDATEPLGVRRSPDQRAPVRFDPEALRNELAGAFPGPGQTDDERDSSPQGAESTPSDESVAFPLRSEPTPSAAEFKNLSSGPQLSADDDDHYQQNPLTPNVPPTIPGANASAAARAFDASSEPRSSNNSSAADVTPFGTTGSLVDRDEAGRRERFGDSMPTAPTTPAVLATNQAPVITSDIHGPQQITIGREASYRLRLKNQGSVPADRLVANIRIPSWAEIVSSTATHGSVRQGDGADASETLQWEIPRLEPQATETLDLTLIPRASRPLELGVVWTYAPVDSRAVVEVQEPKLRMQVAGPDEVLFGKSHVYRLTLTNSGTGMAQNVCLELVPPGGNEGSASTHRVGDLPPGGSKTVEVELIAREAGKLNVAAVATADGGLSAEATKELFCRKPELEVDWRGPEMQYAGTPATYFFRVRNPGTAAADDVVVRVNMPAGAEFLSGSEGHVKESGQGDIVWRVGTLGPGDDCYMELRCMVHTPGENQLRITAAAAAGDLSDRKVAITDVVALADLKLEVSDPPGPVPVGDEALYEIRIQNRGTSAAEEVDVVGLFSAGLEPEAVEGAPYSVADGRVSFRTIRKIPAGQKILLQIRARATKPGTHVFRAEVLCRDLEIKLAAEETTRFYETEVGRSQSPDDATKFGAQPLGPLR